MKYVAAKYNIEIIEEALTDEQASKISAKESQFIATKFANKYFQDRLWNTEEGRSIGLSYFKERGYTNETIKKFQLGYSPKKQNSFEKAAIKSGYDKKILIESSLVGENENGKTYDKFRERTIFPIHSYSGRVIAFGGRAFNADAKSKYLNSGETLIYDKSKVLYGLNITKQEIRKANKCFIVEGYTDVIAMYQSGIKNVVSASGTALGPYQVNLIKRSTNNVVLLFDADDAGVKATIRTINLCLKLEMNVKTASFPKGEDPDSYSKKLTSDEFQKHLDTKTINFVDYLIDIYKLSEESDPGKIIEIKKNIILSISEIPDVFSREEYCKIYHHKLGVSEGALLQQINRARATIKNNSTKTIVQKSTPLNPQKNPIHNSGQKLHQLEKEVLRLLINYGNNSFAFENENETVASMIINELHQDEIQFAKLEHQKLYTAIINGIKKDGLINVQKLTNNCDNEISQQSINLIAQAHNISENWKQKHNIITGREEERLQKTTEKAILALKKGIVDFQISDLQKQLKNGDINNVGISRLNELTKLKSQIAKLLGRNIG